MRVHIGALSATNRACRDMTATPFTADWSSTGAEVGGFARASVMNNGDGTYLRDSKCVRPEIILPASGS
jgi:hypothetical protein